MHVASTGVMLLVCGSDSNDDDGIDLASCCMIHACHGMHKRSKLFVMIIGASNMKVCRTQ